MLLKAGKDWLNKLAIPVIVGAALTTGPAIASADPVNPTSQDMAHLAKVKSLGFAPQPGWSYEAIFIGIGIGTCSAKTTETPDEIAHNIQAGFKGSPWEKNGNCAGLRDLAESVNCPGN